jgi:hypothetical protein
MKKDTGKWFDFHKNPWHNIDEFLSKNSLVSKIKEKELNPDSMHTPLLLSRQIINAYPTAIVMTTTIQPEEPRDFEEGEHLFHSHMWVKGTPLHFIIDRGSHKRSSNSWDSRKHHTRNHTTSGGFCRYEIFV